MDNNSPWKQNNPLPSSQSKSLKITFFSTVMATLLSCLEGLIFWIGTRLTWDDARRLTLLLGLKVVGVSSAASVLEQLTEARVYIEEEPVLDGLAGSRLVLHRAEFVKDERFLLESDAWGKKRKQNFTNPLSWRVLFVCFYGSFSF